ncbi:N-acetylmuramoyl-L-alanine amidase [Pelagibius litoralis]|uniref:N-acetylmuramoyl-L-alanine amidase n=1 Tax=Pelagibius litoralis TaxID=374515 RepID=A0A967C982_9PROT|nr:N-acetylmuramoyl-L-alanine amidase [Pelagibius litoralis]NIA69132.1 N-acetylmuramoyl-L-alanine amidase [Pelagibius litoralis]
MQIRRHRLHLDSGEPVRYAESPNRSGVLTPRFLIMHYTAGGSFEGSLRHMTKRESSASAHLLIGRDGAIAQLVPFNRIAWHAGVSRWQGLSGLNRHSIGIELDNAGPLDRQGDQWRAWFGRDYPKDQVLVARHKNGGRRRGWHSYSEAQIATALEAATALCRHYDLADVLGHDDVAPDRKTDPGPAFPMESFRAAALGRQSDAPQLFETTANLNIRDRPGLDGAKLPEAPLAAGTRLSLLSQQGKWAFVEVLDAQGKPEATGWVHSDYIAALPPEPP